MSPYYSSQGLKLISFMELMQEQAPAQQVHIPLLLVQLYMRYNELEKARRLLNFLREEDPKAVGVKISWPGY